MKMLGPAAIATLICLSAQADELRVDTDVAAVRAAVSRSLPFLAKDGRAWMDGKIEMQDGKKCVSCHYVSFGVWSHEAASLAGLQVDREQVNKLNSDAAQFISDPKVGRVVTYAHLMMANLRPADEQKKTFADFAQRIVKLQEKPGFWKAKGQFPSQERPVAESNAVATMWALVATRPHAADKAVADSRARAIKWLTNSKAGVSTEWYAWRLIVAKQEQQKDDKRWLKAILSRQRSDGGWSWLEKNDSDAYTTGQVLYALIATGHADSEAVERGIQFLLRSQNEDGTWTVPSKLVSAGPDENKDRIYTYWGTAWAAIALSRSQQTSLAAK